ncbi:MAG: GTP cyclohydrolase I FolE [Candidatus Dormibacterales bacterium]
MSVLRPRLERELPDGAPGRELESTVARMLELVGEDLGRPGLAGTPERVARSLRDLVSGSAMSAAEVVGDAIFEQDYDEVVLVKDIQFYSLCEHHLLPFFGSCHVAYMPRGKIVGLSKIPRVVGVFSRRLQLQERLTRQIAEAFEEVVTPAGTAVVMEARHMCMEMRGVERPGNLTVTSCMLGVFREDPRSRAEVMELIRR